MKKTLALQPNLVHMAWAINLYRLATDIVGVFIPLIILQSGGRLWYIGLFYLLYAVLKLCLNYRCMRLIQRRGPHFGLALGFMFSGLQLVGILAYAHTHSLILLLSSALTFALTNGFLWNAQHFFISKLMDDASKSSSIASIEVYGRLADIAGPIIGGVVGSLFGTEWLVVVALACLITTTIPLRGIRDITSSRDDSEPFSYTLSGAPIGDLIANFCFNIETLIGKMVWPVYLAVILHQYKAISGVATVAAVASIITTSVAGRLGDRGKDRAVLKQGVAVSSLVDVARLAATASSLIVVVSAAYEASLAYFTNAWASTYYHHAQQRGTQYIVSMEIACDLAYAGFWGLFFILTLSVHSSRLLFDIVFLIAAAAAWGCLLITRQRSGDATGP